MLTITVPKGEFYDEVKGVFHVVERDITLQLEHSLISVQKWESKWHRSFLNKANKTQEETIDYVRCMCLTKNVNDDVFYCIPQTEMVRIAKYIEDPMTATHIRHPGGSSGSSRKKEIITAELIYYWMITENIPTEYRKWHLNQLLTLIEVINVKNTPPKKRSRKAIMEEYRAINEENRKRFNTRG